ncbi:hypothetical protein SAMN05444156_3142 [Verrucomicrobium sp. GAS474]|uniref:energy transducer TonB n=1 Tax=Verrucomicrobium sp. GAS474 TaxID=1882831 RepID=UPI00087D424B|nr:hypothetical protein [Verrucomicrobium sp. GAS474]SDU29751.1 hypothetical protein SAMN05444156_3142 [Verrucomicrobium sp. GAS474]
MWDPKHFHFLGEALEAVPEERRRLGILILLVLVLHGAGFLALRVAYPESSPVISPSRQRLMIYSPAPGGSRMPTVADIGFWSRIDDPSLVVFPPDVTTLPEEARGGSARYHPSGETDATAAGAGEKPGWGGGPTPSAPQALVALEPDVRLLPDTLPPLAQRAADALAVAGPKQVFRYNFSPFTPAAPGTSVRWDGAFASRAPAKWVLPGVTSDLLPEAGVTVLRLAVDGEGKVSHVLVEESCGNSETDLTAVLSARRLRFAPVSGDAPAPLAWGNATVYWRFVPKGGAAAANASGGGATPSAGTEKTP